ncbi:hypothetical protein RDI58_025149 [Solanum bulbocastanum]|uniref:Uncharacterized protein n=1 Tax=Solanum bulbocastanum TaxID=147425 RepID=A0AAN8T770_SOLBU
MTCVINLKLNNLYMTKKYSNNLM